MFISRSARLRYEGGMKKVVNHIVAGLICAFALAPGVATAIPFGVPEAPASTVVKAAGDCRAIGQRKAAQHGGVLADVRVEQRGGRTVCVGVIIVQGKNGERGQRIPFEEPL